LGDYNIILSKDLNLGTVNHKVRSQTYCDKVVGRKGNNLDY